MRAIAYSNLSKHAPPSPRLQFCHSLTHRLPTRTYAWHLQTSSKTCPRIVQQDNLHTIRGRGNAGAVIAWLVLTIGPQHVCWIPSQHRLVLFHTIHNIFLAITSYSHREERWYITCTEYVHLRQAKWLASGVMSSRTLRCVSRPWVLSKTTGASL